MSPDSDSHFQRLGYIGASSQLTDDTLALILGLPYDGTASYRSGQRFAPNQIRTVSEGNLETYDRILDLDLEQFPFTDLGDLYMEHGMDAEYFVNAAREGLASLQHSLPIVGLGGEHTVTLPLVEHALRREPELGILVFDAHTDLRDSYAGTQYSHACVIRRIHDLIGPERIAMIGPRSGLQEEFELAEQGSILFPATDDGLIAALKKLGNRPIYLSFDLDAFDPAELPGTGTPEAGGLKWVDVVRWLMILKDRDITAADVVELLPDADPTGRSTVLAARLVRALLLLVLQSQKRRIG
jgi:agmatinase